MIYRLVHDEARSRAKAAIDSAPEGYVVRIAEPRRSLEQNDLLHALLTDVGQKIGWKWSGFTIDLDDLKSIFVAAYRKIEKQNARILPGVDGEPVLMSWRTRDMGKREMSELITMIYAWEAQNL